MTRSRGMYCQTCVSAVQHRLIPCIVLSFMSAFGGSPREIQPAAGQSERPENTAFPSQRPSTDKAREPGHAPKTRGERPSSQRPISTIGGYQSPLMEISQDTIPELLPIFTFLNSHSNKLYQEGYFLKLNDLDSRTISSSLDSDRV